MMKTISSYDLYILGSKVFAEFILAINQYRNKSQIVVGLSGGSSVNILYNQIRDNAYNIPMAVWKKIKFVFVDERVVPLDSVESNYYALNKLLFNPLIKQKYLSKDQIVPIDIQSKNPAKNYYEKVPYIDVALLGVGEDGHTCSLFPYHKILKNKSISYLEVEDAPKPPSKRITISKNYLQSIYDVFVFFIGENKKLAYQNFLDIQVLPKKCPAKYALEVVSCNVVTNLDY